MPDEPTGADFITQALTRDDTRDAALRPVSFDDFRGQPKTVERLMIMTGAARKRDDVVSHILLSGPPGLGKTTLAHIVGHVMERRVHITAGPVIERPGDLAGMLTNLEEGDILFIDEIHRVPKTVE
jgi:Holliday junction DNA helicase RuvB